MLCIWMSAAIDGRVLMCLLFSVVSCGGYCQITHSIISFGSSQVTLYVMSCIQVTLYVMSCGQAMHSMMQCGQITLSAM